MLLVGLGGLVAGGTGDQLVDLGGLVLLVVVATLDGVVGLCLVGVVYKMSAAIDLGGNRMTYQRRNPL